MSANRTATRRRGRGSSPLRLGCESLEGRQVLNAGAVVPWVRYEAEQGVRGQTAAVVAPGRGIGTLAGEASGRQAVTLGATGDFVEWTVAAPANALVMRLSIPDAPGGGGINSSIGIFRNGQYLQDVAVTSKYAWLYGDDNAVTNSPASGPARRLYDESRALLTTPLAAGDTIRVQRTAANTAASYTIDFIELENVAPLVRPANSISIVDKGAVANDSGDDTAAIAAAIADARAQGKEVWIPPGQFRQSQMITASGVAVRGAGMWYSEIWGYNPRGDNAVGFNVAGGGTRFSDFRILGEQTARGVTSWGTSGFYGAFGVGSELKNIWIERTECGAWVGVDNSPAPASNLRIEGLRIRNTFADGVNLCNGTTNSIIVNCTARATGDDSFAIWSAPSATRAGTGNVIRNNTAECTWKAAGIAVYGGGANLVENNLVADTLTYPGVTIASSFNAKPFEGVTTIRGNTLLRCGGVAWGQEHAALWVYVDDRSIAATVDVVGNQIVDATFAAFEINASNRGNAITGPVTFAENTVTGAERLLWVAYYARGSATLRNNVVSGLRLSPGIKNDAGTAFTVVESVAPPVAPPAASPPTFVVSPRVAATAADGRSVTLAALGADDGGEAALAYGWSVVGPAAVTLSRNANNAAKETVATFTRPGTYTFTATITDAGGLKATSSVVVNVAQRLTSIAVSPATARVLPGTVTALRAIGSDQFGAVLSVQPAFVWSTTAGSVTVGGAWTAPAIAGAARVTAAVGGVAGSATITVDAFTAGQDIGGVGRAGSHALDPASGTYTVAASGVDIAGTVDSFRLVSRSMSGDVTVTARVDGQTASDPAAKAGVMIRQSTAANAAFAGVFVTPGNGVTFQWRTAAGAAVASVELRGVSAPAWVRLVRRGSVFTALTSADGLTWTQVGSSRTIAMSPTVLAGLAVTSRNNAALSTATFRGVSVAAGVNPTGAAGVL